MFRVRGNNCSIPGYGWWWIVSSVTIALITTVLSAIGIFFHTLPSLQLDSGGVRTDGGQASQYGRCVYFRRGWVFPFKQNPRFGVARIVFASNCSTP